MATPRKAEPAKREAKGREPLRTYRCSDELYDRVKAKADKQGRPIADVIREAFETYAPGRRRSKNLS